MAEILVNIGQPIILNAQLSDADLSLPKIVKARIKAPDYSTVNELTLAHVGSGLFVNDSFQMPEVPFLIAQYLVFETDGVTQDFNYSVGLNVFRNVEDIGLGGSGSVGKRADEIVAELSTLEQEFIVEVSDVSNK